MSSHPRLARPSFRRRRLPTALCTRRQSHIISPQRAGENCAHLHLSDRLTETNSRARAEREKRLARRLHAGLGRALRCVGDPALRPPRVRVGEVVGVAVEGVLDDADLGGFGEVLVVDREAARLDVARQVVGDRGEDAHGFVDAGAEVGA